jgi:hypothetical protein
MKAAPLGAVFCLPLITGAAPAKEVAEMPFWHQPPDTAGLGAVD